MIKNVKRVNMECKILGFNSSLPFFIAPAAMTQLGQPEGNYVLLEGHPNTTSHTVQATALQFLMLSLLSASNTGRVVEFCFISFM